MEKKALAAKTLLKALSYGGGGLALAGGGAAVGHKFGVRAGAQRMGNQMAVAFSEANAKENKAIVDSFKAYNKKENAQIANSFFNRGVMVGHKMKNPGPVKTASDIRTEAFNDELEKLALSGAMLKGIGSAALKSFKRLGTNLSRAAGTMKSGYKMHGLRQAGQAFKRSPGATLALTGAGSYGLGRRGRTNRTIVEHRSA